VCSQVEVPNGIDKHVHTHAGRKEKVEKWNNEIGMEWNGTKWNKESESVSH